MQVLPLDSFFLDYTKLETFFFPVGIHDLYFDTNKKDKPTNFPQDLKFVRDFKAVVDEEMNEMLSCVSPSYTLITNRWAYEMGIEIAKIIFRVDSKDIDFWYGEITEKRGACYLFIRVLKTIKVSGVENQWFAYVRVSNSYNKTRSLAYDVGFCLETMDDREVPLGLLVPSLSLRFSANHLWRLGTIRKKLMDAVHDRYYHLNVFGEFESMVRTLLDIEVVDDEILPLFCRLAKLKSLDPHSKEDLELASLVMQIEKVSSYWIKKCGPNAYAALCAYADFVSRYAKEVHFLNNPTEFQSQLGQFVDELIDAKYHYRSAFSLDEFIGKQAREIKKQIKIMCANM